MKNNNDFFKLLMVYIHSKGLQEAASEFHQTEILSKKAKFLVKELGDLGAKLEANLRQKAQRELTLSEKLLKTVQTLFRRLPNLPMADVLFLAKSQELRDKGDILDLDDESFQIAKRAVSVQAIVVVAKSLDSAYKFIDSKMSQTQQCVAIPCTPASFEKTIVPMAQMEVINPMTVVDLTGEATVYTANNLLVYVGKEALWS